jgi:hypothetical protein
MRLVQECPKRKNPHCSAYGDDRVRGSLPVITIETGMTMAPAYTTISSHPSKSTATAGSFSSLSMLPTPYRRGYTDTSHTGSNTQPRRSTVFKPCKHYITGDRPVNPHTRLSLASRSPDSPLLGPTNPWGRIGHMLSSQIWIVPTVGQHPILEVFRPPDPHNYRVVYKLVLVGTGWFLSI